MFYTVCMNVAAIQGMSRAEKLQMMEALWEDLAQSSMDIESPQWHKTSLRETELRLTKGQEKIHDWSTAKNILRQRAQSKS